MLHLLYFAAGLFRENSEGGGHPESRKASRGNPGGVFLWDGKWYKGGSMGRGCESVFEKKGVQFTVVHGSSDKNLLSFSDFTRRRGVVSLRTESNGQFATWN